MLFITVSFFPFFFFLQLMMLVDYGSSIVPIIAHSPWNGVRLADFVMPFFLFIAGISPALVYKVRSKFPSLHFVAHTSLLIVKNCTSIAIRLSNWWRINKFSILVVIWSIIVILTYNLFHGLCFTNAFIVFETCLCLLFRKCPIDLKLHGKQ